ncbi:sigma-54 interaction domain-containing protein [Desulfoscipio sp. XC116]|uniref:sigma-54 interaction domain-containing protein n=1 Tax=Desulfoscipio sp. XC116 TaxID=3144975 RepID=UPI00325C10A3
MITEKLLLSELHQIIRQPVALVPESWTMDQLNSMIGENEWQGIIWHNESGRITGACTADCLATLAISSQPLKNAIRRHIFICHTGIALNDLLACETLEHADYIVLVNEGDNQPVGLINLWQLNRWLWEQCRDIQHRLNAVLDTVHEAVTIIDHAHMVVGWNRRAEELYNIPAAKILGRTIHTFFTDLMVTRVMENNRQVINAYHQPCADTHVLINSRPIKRDNRLIGSVSAEWDITEIINLHQQLTRANTQVSMLKKQISGIGGRRDGFYGILGHGKRLTEAINLARKVADTNAAVLLRGQSGTGKELFAEAIHRTSERAAKPFIVLNCGAIPPTLFESELFGYQGGAFTGADRRGKPGKFELAHRGTLFLDEIGELQPDMQVKLLRVLQNEVFYRVGGNEPIQVDVRIIAATNRDLELMITQGNFREDLYYRLNVISLELPNLNEHKEDIPELVYAFIHEFAGRHHRAITRVSPEVMSALLGYHWPGNVRELRNVVERLVILTEEGTIGLQHLPTNIKHPVLSNMPAEQSPTLPNITRHTELDVITNALQQAGYNKAVAARMLGIPRSTLYYKMKTLGIKHVY